MANLQSLKEDIPILRTAGVVLAATCTIWFAYWLTNQPEYSRTGLFTLLAGLMFGVVLQRSRFCFYCILSDFFLKKNGKPLVGIIAALLVGGICYQILFGAWIADPSAGYLPPEAHIGPVSWHLILGGLLFGWGMVLSGSCISAHMYRLGEGSLIAPVALAGTVAGFMAGYMAWNPLYLSTIASAPIIWMPSYAGYSAAFLIQNSILAGLLIWLLVKYPGQEVSGTYNVHSNSLSDIRKRVFVDRWPSWAGGIGVGLIAIFYYFRVEPLGVTAGIGRLSRKTGESAGLVPEQILGLGNFSGCVPLESPVLFSSNGIFVLALIAGSLICSLLAGQFKMKSVSLNQVLFGLAGGFLLGFGAMISLGCTIGTTLSGIMAYAVSGWVFTAGMLAGVWSGLRIKFRESQIKQ